MSFSDYQDEVKIVAFSVSLWDSWVDDLLKFKTKVVLVTF
jgi:hypothetical protein